MTDKDNHTQLMFVLLIISIQLLAIIVCLFVIAQEQLS